MIFTSIAKVATLVIGLIVTATLADVASQGVPAVHFINVSGKKIFISGDWPQENVNTLGPESLSNLDHELEHNDTITITSKPSTSPKFFLGISPNNRTAEVGEKRDHDTVVEATFHNVDKKTYYDIDIEKGTSVPVWCHGTQETWLEGIGCHGDVLANCPTHLQHFGQDGNLDQCRAEFTPADVERRRQLCPRCYAVHTDDKRGTSVIGPESPDEIVCTIMDPKNATFATPLELPPLENRRRRFVA